MRNVREPLFESDRVVSRKAEQQMRRAALISEIRSRKRREDALAELANQIKPYLSISRQTGAGGAEIAQQVGRRLGWNVLTRDEFETLAEQSHMSHAMIDLVDETTYRCCSNRSANGSIARW